MRMPEKIVTTRIFVFAFELFMGERCQRLLFVISQSILYTVLLNQQGQDPQQVTDTGD